MMKKELLTKTNTQKTKYATPTPRSAAGFPAKKNGVSAPPGAGLKKDELGTLKDAAATVHQIKRSALQELELARRMREDARKYQQETATKARSEAQLLILKTRLATQRETEELVRQASEEIQKVLADIRMIRIMAQEELAAQRKFTDAARLHTMSLALRGESENPGLKRKK
jgi:SepF-like predicted cell division protein (DUF552 family)